MRSNVLTFLPVMAVIIAVSCSSGAGVKPADAGPEMSVTEPAASADAIEVFDPNRVSQQQYDTTMEEVRRFIYELNLIISSRNYNAWRATLSAELFAEFSSPEFLAQASESPAMRTRRIVLRTAEDYFINVVVPSRANSRVDDIEFIDRNRVQAFTINTNRAGEEVRLRLYDLEKIGNSWIIIN